MKQKSLLLKSAILVFALVSGLLAWNVAVPSGHALAAASAACSPGGTTYGTDTLSVAIPSAGTYSVWSRIQVPSTPSGAPLLLNVDNATGNGCYDVGDSSVSPNTWVWVNSGSQAFTQASHTFVYTGLQAGASLDRIEVLSDSSCTPTGTGDNCTPVADTTPPTVSVTAPTSGATVSGTTTISANAADNVAVASVQFKLDGNNIGTADTTSPYSFSWNTTGVSNGNHSLTAVATDTSGLSTTSSSVTVTVNNAAVCGTGTVTAPSALHQTASTYTTVGLGWAASTPSQGCTISRYNIFRNGTQVGTSTTTSYTDSGLTASNSYAYTVEGVDSGPNTSAKSSSSSFSTTADNVAPDAPTNASATALSAGSIKLTWTASNDNPNPGGTGVTGYNIYRNSATTPTFTVSSASAGSFTDTTVSASTHYTYTVTAFDVESNESAPSNVASATTPAPTCSGNPTLPTNPVAGTSTINSISFSWTASTASAGCTLSGYHIYQVNGSTYTLVNTVSSGTSTTISGLAPNTSFVYAIEAFDTSGHSSARTTTITIATKADTSPPTAPASVTATAPASSQVNLVWAASTDNIGVTNYNIYRGGTLLATVSGTLLSYSDNTVKASTTYTYQVSALDAANNESIKTSSNSIQTPATTDTQDPTTPTNLTAPVVASQSADLTPTASY